MEADQSRKSRKVKPLSENHDLWTIERLISWTSRFFGQKGIDSPRLDAELLLAHVMGKQRIYLYTIMMKGGRILIFVRN